jgi:hypothetical protein
VEEQESERPLEHGERDPDSQKKPSPHVAVRSQGTSKASQELGKVRGGINGYPRPRSHHEDSSNKQCAVHSEVYTSD